MHCVKHAENFSGGVERKERTDLGPSSNSSRTNTNTNSTSHSYYEYHEQQNDHSNKVSKRSKALSPAEYDYYYEDENLDERDNPTYEAPVVPPLFLSPSVREYLDLGKSIPGT